MMQFFLRILITALCVIFLAKIMPNITVDSYGDAILVALVLGFLNAFLRPLLAFFSFPLTIVTLGISLLFINAGMIMLADYFLDGFHVGGWLWALLFSLALFFMRSVLFAIFKIEN